MNTLRGSRHIAVDIEYPFSRVIEPDYCIGTYLTSIRQNHTRAEQLIGLAHRRPDRHIGIDRNIFAHDHIILISFIKSKYKIIHSRRQFETVLFGRVVIVSEIVRHSVYHRSSASAGNVDSQLGGYLKELFFGFGGKSLRSREPANRCARGGSRQRRGDKQARKCE